ncbi:MAG: phosphosulfolactate synthase [Rhodospirillaceae bacterium]|jgi:phosphosulfolactate synthase
MTTDKKDDAWLDKPSFDFLTIPTSKPKPRKDRWTIMSDRSMPTKFVDDYLTYNGNLIDEVKFVDFTGIHRISARTIVEKNKIYKKHGIPTFPGGVAFEIAYLQGKIDEFYDRVIDLGFTGMEVSTDSMPELLRDERSALIKKGTDMGLQVFTEVGKKFFDEPFPPEEAVDCIKADLDAGAVKVVLENTELCHYHQHDQETLRKIIEPVGLENVILEIGRNGWPHLTMWLIREYGPDINVENIEHEKIVTLEGMRRGLQRIMGYEYLSTIQNKPPQSLEDLKDQAG